MCFHIHSHIPKKAKSYVEDLFDASFLSDNTPEFHHVNGFQHPSLAIITQENPDQIVNATWSVAPPNSLDPALYWKEKGGSTLNTRDDSLFSYKSAAWKSEAVLKQKCIVLVNGYFEPHKVSNVSYPYLLHRPNFDVFGLVGYYTKQKDNSLTFSVITTKANEFVGKVHNAAQRMPMSILPEDKESIFDLTTESDLKNEFQLCYSVPLKAKPVDRAILNSRIDTNSDQFLNDVFHPIITDF